MDRSDLVVLSPDPAPARACKVPTSRQQPDPSPAWSGPQRGRDSARRPGRGLRVAALLTALAAPNGLVSFALPLAVPLALAPAASAVAQGQDFGRVVSPILTLDRDQLFANTLYGQRVNRELEAASTAMAAETRAIEAALEAEEKELTEKRATMTPDAFRELATAFDDKVQKLRAERDAAETDLRAQIEAAQLAFFNRIGPVLGQVVRDRGAVMIVDRRAVLLAAANIDITSEAIERIDAVLGDGGDLGTGTGDGGGGTAAPAQDLETELDGTLGADPAGDATEAPLTAPSAPEVDTIPAPLPPGESPDAGTDN